MRTEITTEAALRDLLGTPLQRVLDKDRPALTPEHRDWLAASPLCLVATSDAEGRLDVSPKGDPAGFALVVDDTTIAIPERPGNRRADGFVNILQNPHVGLIFLVPGRGDTLRVNGRATILADAPYADRMEVAGHRPAVILEVAVEQVFFHCAKAFLRSSLWKPETWRPDAVMSRAQIAKNLERPDDSIEELEAYYGEQYADGLY
ncbi:pyridoxamine 5'-phosphate oxidase family protein [Aeromicrobium stalagmiti]|uniref:pyridoxamine 5'-phosphate oxidase family protein n=1 Tax=Aeromicrobium stalagmiti TaxID=2738988 RepID=UPI0015691AFD|nr:pyridoxamine 5'-phosphate oxidase family protein [Aeromicrobium stalagmiti]NRQ49896.1 pyridoxamine 5'-phosphate oxidase family protein [Aeromicrobium stalagmiti]